MGIVATASLITAFMAGIAALFAPCCIGVLLPSYLASVFKTRTKIFLMTFVYYLGLLTIFLPMGFGFASLGVILSQYHNLLFTVGGLFMVALGMMLIFGKSLMLPWHVHPVLRRRGYGSLYVLGVFSGIATSCCAPVLAGVMALSAMPGSWWLGSFYALAFVTGMVLPLFAVALFADRSKLAERLQSFRHTISYSFFGEKVRVSLSHLAAGILYLLIGVIILLFERQGPETFGSGYQLRLNFITARITQLMAEATRAVPDAVWAIVFVAAFVLIALSAYRQAKNNPDDTEKES